MRYTKIDLQNDCINEGVLLNPHQLNIVYSYMVKFDLNFSDIKDLFLM